MARAEAARRMCSASVGQNQRNTVPVPGPLMNEVNVHAVELGAELSGRVQLAFLCLPIEFAGPILKQLPEVLKVSPPPAPTQRLVPEQASGFYECALEVQTRSLPRCGWRTE